MKLNKYLNESGYLFIIALGVMLYFQQAWVPGFFHDGYLYSAFAKHAAQDGHWLIPRLSLSTYSEFPVHPPFIFSLNGLFFKFFGASYTTARLFSGLFTLLCLVSLIEFVKQYGSEKWAFFSGLAFVLIPPLFKKTRFPNLDAPLMLFVFLGLYFYFKAYKNHKKSNWVICGLFFGLAMLTKGPMAGLIPLGILAHLLVTKSWKLLADPVPWLSLLLGFVIFSVWPVTLYLTDNQVTWDWYIKTTFVFTMMEGRGVSEFNFFDYFIFLFKQTSPWFIAAIYSFRFVRSNKKSDLHIFSLLVFFSLLIFLSIPKFKYSNYLLPLYPFYAIIVGYALQMIIKDNWLDKAKKSVMYLFVLGSLILLIFPLTTNIRRDKEIFKTLEISKGLKVQPDVWVTIDSSYPFFALANLIGFELDGEVVNTTEDWLKDYLLGNRDIDFKSELPINWKEREFLFLMRNETYKKIRPFLGDKLKSIVHFVARDIVVLARNSNIDPNGLQY